MTPAGRFLSPGQNRELRGTIVSERKIFYRLPSDDDLVVCHRCGELRRWGDFMRDRSKRSGRGSMCRWCNAEKSREYYAENREAILEKQVARRGGRRLVVALECSECGDPLEPPRRVVCSPRCREARFKRLHPESYAAREAAKVVRRRERRQAAKAAT